MKASIVLKTLLITLPILFLGACSSTADTDASKKTETAQKKPESNVETGKLSTGKLSKEEKVKKYGDAILNSTVWFNFDDATIAPKYIKSLKAHAKELVDNPKMKITIQGYTDEQGTPEYNVALSERRAKAVSKYLKSNGVGSNQIKLVSYGEEKPLNKGHTKAAHAQNRRAKIVKRI